MSIQLILILGLLVAQLSAEISLPHSLRHLSLPLCGNTDGWHKNPQPCNCLTDTSMFKPVICKSSTYCLIVPDTDPGTCSSHATCDTWDDDDCPDLCPDGTGKELVTNSCLCKRYVTTADTTGDVCIDGQYCNRHPDNSNFCSDQASKPSPSPSPKPSTPFCKYTNGGQKNSEQCDCCDTNGPCWDPPCAKKQFLSL